MATIDWEKIRTLLPVGNTVKEKQRRKTLFKSFDSNGNGILSLAEVDKAIRDVLKIDAVFNAKPAIMRAFQIAKDYKKSKREDIAGDDYIELNEFKFFLISLRQYFEYYVAFTRVDSNMDNKISLSEFKAAQKEIEKWVGSVDPEQTFYEIDDNHGGSILFDEFCQWAIKKNLDIEDDDDFDASEFLDH